jgi:tight adherence protein B
MLVWLSLSIFFLAIFTSVLLIWRRAGNVKRSQKLMKSILDSVDPARPTVTTTRTLVEPPAPAGLARFFRKPAAESGQHSANEGKGRFIVLTVVMLAVGMLVGSRFQDILGPAATFICMGAFGATPFIIRSRKSSRRLAAIEEQFPDALDFLARSIRAGNAFSVSLELLCAEASEPLRLEFVRVTRELTLGSPLEVALNGLTERAPLMEVRFFVSAVLLQRDTGGNLSEVLGKLGTSVRERLRLRGHVRAASGQGRLTALVLTALPVATLVILKLVSPDYMNALTEDPLGRDMLAAAVISQVMGFLVMRKITQIEV